MSARTGPWAGMYGTRTVNQDGLERRADCLWALGSVESLQICHVREFIQIARDPDRVLVRRSWLIRRRVVELKEARDRNHIGTVYAKARIRKHRGDGGARVSNGGGGHRDVDKSVK